MAKPEVLMTGPMPAIVGDKLDAAFTLHRLLGAPDGKRSCAMSGRVSAASRRAADTGVRTARSSTSCRISKSYRASASATTTSTRPRRAGAASSSPTRPTSSTTRWRTWPSACSSRPSASCRRRSLSCARGSGSRSPSRSRRPCAGARSASSDSGASARRSPSASRPSAFRSTTTAAPSRRTWPIPTTRRLSESAQAVDVLIVITPGGAATRHLVNAEVLKALGPNGVSDQRRPRQRRRRARADRGAARQDDPCRPASTCSRTSRACRRS